MSPELFWAIVGPAGFVLGILVFYYCRSVGAYDAVSYA